MKTSSTMNMFVNKCFKVGSHLKEGIKKARSLLFSSKKVSIKEKDEVLFLTLSSTFQDEDIWVIDSGASRHVTGHSKQLKTLSKGKSTYSVC